MPRPLLILLTTLAMIAFAGNSLLYRAALKHTGINAASFTTIRLISGALMLWLVLDISHRTYSGRGNGIGRSNWYTALPSLKADKAATVQLSVPLIASPGGIVFIGEPLTPPWYCRPQPYSATSHQ